MQNAKLKSGLTSVELLVALAVLLVLGAAVVAGFGSMRNKSALDSAAYEVVSVLNQARLKTLASQNDRPYGVHFESQRAVLFKGTAFSGGDPSNEEANIPLSVEILPAVLNGGGSDVVFKRLTGETDNYGTITLSLKSDPSKIKIIIIEATGVIGNE